MNKLKRIVQRIIQLLIIFILSGTIYCIIEILFKGPERGTHWSMFMLAGLAGVVFIDGLNNVFSYEMDYLLQGIICSVMITIWEYFTGNIFNLDYSIWDYRDMPLNLNGQICLPFMLVWFIIAMIFIPILDYIEWKWFKYKVETPPHYKIFGHVIFRFGKEKDNG